MKYILSFVFCFIFISALYASSREEVVKEFQSRLKQHQQRINQLFNSDFFNDDFDGFDSFGEIRKSAHTKVQWIEKPDEKILSLELGNQKDSPVDIEIKDGQITVKAEIKTEEISKNRQTGFESKSVSISSYHNVFSVPYDCDEKKAVIKQGKDGEVLIHFPKKLAHAKKKRRKAVKVDGKTI